MQVLNYTQFRNNLKSTLDSVAEDQEVYIINRGENQHAVVLSLKEYNALQETLHLLSTETNRERLLKAIERDKTGQYESHQLID